MYRLCRRVAPFSAWAMTLLACGNSSPKTVDDTATASSFLPIGSDFQNFHAWDSFPADAPEGAPLTGHDLGPMTVYINMLPEHGSTEFAVGTIIVKETQEDDPTTRKIFAMAKRGGTYNKNGAVGWEWFELINNASGTVSENWRGLGPPAGEHYGGDAKGGCNGCHGAMRRENDSVWTLSLALDAF